MVVRTLSHFAVDTQRSIDSCNLNFFEKCLAMLTGAGICGTAAITAIMMCWTNIDLCNKKESNNQRADKTKGNIYDLEEIGKRKAWAWYKLEQESKGSVSGKKKELVLKLNWDDVKSFPEKPNYRKSTAKHQQEDEFRVIFQAVFQNKSNTDQLQNLRAEVETLSTSNSSLTKGYSKGSEVGLSLKAPDEVAKAASAFSNGFWLKHIHGNLEVKPMPWVIDEMIRVPKHSKITVSKGVKGRNREFDFKAMIGFEGDVQGTFYNQNKQRVASHTISITAIIKELPKDMILEKNGRYYIKINGRCAFKYDIEQKITKG